MPATKNAWLRYLIIVKTIKNGGANKSEILHAISDELGVDVSESTIEKDISFLKYSSEFGIYAPIIYRHADRGYWLPPNWSMSEAIKKTWRI